MARLDVLALVLAGGAGSRMEVLTQDRAKPALPFAGVYRLLDFPLSNLRHSAIDDVWLLVQFETQSILDVVAGGRPWDLDRSHGGLRIVPPQQESGDDGGQWHAGNAHAIYTNRHLIAGAEPDALLVMSADHVYKLDYADVVAQHQRTGAEATVVTTRVPVAQAKHHVVLDIDEGGIVRGCEVKPEKPSHGVVAAEVFVFDTAVALELLEQLGQDDDADGEGLGDFGDRLLPALVERGRVHEFALSGYWKDVGRPETYFAAHRDVLVARSRRRSSDLQLDDSAWPILTHDVPRMPALIESGGQVVDSLVGPACRIAGRVERSVLGPGVVVQEGAVVRDSILLNDVTVRARARVQHAIVADGATVGADAVVGAGISGDLPTSDELVLIGAAARIAAGAKVPAGDRIDPGGRRRAT
ncbi:glucose-1-phosphate adenylyltransferase family protein [Pseudactinotalea suaedae]|uniref:glucose-1-phosphate adenylyltransferase family protein n=1 Tax=Pseudactinotalea suaedae TaxID=1524924 RepID=UPI0012E239FB|nr:sugar phosphate nucleotidyltransferase [Pseudactinotalea suaedae]